MPKYARIKIDNSCDSEDCRREASAGLRFCHYHFLVSVGEDNEADEVEYYGKKELSRTIKTEIKTLQDKLKRVKA